MQEEGVVFYLLTSFWLPILWFTWKQGYSLDVLFIQAVIDSIYINFIFFACWGLYKSQFQLILSSKLVIKILSLIYCRYFVIVDRSHIVRKTFLNESFAKFKISRSLVLLSWNFINYFINSCLRYFGVLVYIMRDILFINLVPSNLFASNGCSPLPTGFFVNKIESSL